MDVFVYGTLTDPDRVADVLADADGGRGGEGDPEWRFVGDARLRGLGRVDGRYPTLAPGGDVDGRILRTDAVAALDAYEGVERGLYVRVPVPRADGSGSVAVYVGDPARLDPAEPVDWPGTGALDRRVREYVAANDVAVEPR